jgi:two-component system chemotaxis response regulator CheB
MPLSALRNVQIDCAAPARDIGTLLARIVDGAPLGDSADAIRYREDLEAEVGIGAATPFERGMMGFGEPSVYTCPDCNGVLFRIREGRMDRFRCHTGHGYTAQALAAELVESSKSSVWHAAKTLQESTALLAESAARLLDGGDAAAAAVLRVQIADIERRLDMLRRIALCRSPAPGLPVAADGL